MAKLYLLPTPNNDALEVLVTEAKLQDQIEIVHLNWGDTRTEEFLAKFPEGQAPAFEDGEFYLSQSGAILRYIARTYEGAEKFYPNDNQVRAQIDSLLEFRQTVFWPPVLTIVSVAKFGRKGAAALPESQDEAKEKAAALPGKIEAFLGDTSFLVGDQLSIADIYITTSGLLILGELGAEPSDKVKAYSAAVLEAAPSIAPVLAKYKK